MSTENGGERHFKTYQPFSVRLYTFDIRMFYLHDKNVCLFEEDVDTGPVGGPNFSNCEEQKITELSKCIMFPFLMVS